MRDMSRVMARLPAGASRACAWRCRRLPLAATFLPLVGLECFAAGRLEWALVGASAVCGLVSVCRGACVSRRHGLAVAAVGLAGWAAWDMARTGRSEAYGAAALLLAGLVAGSHLFSARLCRSCPACRPAPSAENGGAV